MKCFYVRYRVIYCMTSMRFQKLASVKERLYGKIFVIFWAQFNALVLLKMAHFL